MAIWRNVGFAIVGGWFDNNKAGATWVYTRKGGNWVQQGKKLVGRRLPMSAVADATSSSVAMPMSGLRISP